MRPLADCFRTISDTATALGNFVREQVDDGNPALAQWAVDEQAALMRVAGVLIEVAKSQDALVAALRGAKALIDYNADLMVIKGDEHPENVSTVRATMDAALSGHLESDPVRDALAAALKEALPFVGYSAVPCEDIKERAYAALAAAGVA